MPLFMTRASLLLMFSEPVFLTIGLILNVIIDHPDIHSFNAIIIKLNQKYPKHQTPPFPSIRLPPFPPRLSLARPISFFCGLGSSPRPGSPSCVSHAFLPYSSEGSSFPPCRSPASISASHSSDADLGWLLAAPQQSKDAAAHQGALGVLTREK